MNFRDIQEMLDEGEGFQLEFKRKVTSPEKIARALIGFANTKGGTILFGVDDDRSVVGVESEKSEVELVRTSGSFYCDPPIEPEIEIVSYKGKDVIVTHVHESSQKPHMVLRENGEMGDEDSRVFIRVNDKTVVASKEVVRILRAENPDAPPLRLTIGENERRLFDYLEEHETVTVKEFAHLVNVSRRRASRILIQLVRAGVMRIHTHQKEDFYTKAFD
ncbi:MAG: putative DNA binding domain-containing protein [Ignavibacteriales bacterium]|nr:putative DNA binding domain-containing protein [Ignavibacteriales bacterium]